jgi:hypothetical protein
LLLPPGILFAVALKRFFKRRIGYTEFFHDRIAISRDAKVEVPWSEVVGYDDGAREFVELVRAGDARSTDLCIRTRTEEERTAVLALLDSRGVKRINS